MSGLKKYIPALLVLLAHISVYANNSIEWDRKEVVDKNFMTVDSVVGFPFKYANRGNDCITFIKAESSGYIEIRGLGKTVSPGEEGFIEIRFNPSSSPVEFNEEIRLISKEPGNNTTLRLRITQCDNPDLPGSLYRYPIGAIRFKASRIDAGTVFTENDSATDTVPVFNPGKEKIRLSATENPDELEVRFLPETLLPQTYGKMIISFKARNNTKLGYYYQPVHMVQNGEPVPYPCFYYTCYIKRDFSNLSKQEIKNAPRIVLDRTHIDYGSVKENERMTFVYKISNAGINDLQIHDIRTTCGCTDVSMDRYVIPAGETEEMKVEFDSFNRNGLQRKSITIISNDPKSPELTLSFSVNVNK